MIARWMGVGFAHGVMNTDNMSIKGVTIDYGPFGFLDEYDPHFIPNTSDDTGRYDLQNQPSVGIWNLQRLAAAFSALVPGEPTRRLGFEKYGQYSFTLCNNQRYSRTFLYDQRQYSIPYCINMTGLLDLGADN